MLVEELLISCVKRYPELYDPYHPLYLVKCKKNAIWAAIAREVGIPAPHCKSRWNSIRDSYRKSITKNLVRNRSGVKRRQYKYAKSVSFLKQYFRPMKSENESEGDAESTGDVNEPAQETNETNEALSPTQKVKEEDSTSDGYYFDYCDDVVSTELNEAPVVEYQPAVNTIDSFLACVGETLKSLPPYLASLAKAEIYASVHKYELRAITSQNPALAQPEPGPSGRGGGVPLVTASQGEHASAEAIDGKSDPLEPR